MPGGPGTRAVRGARRLAVVAGAAFCAALLSGASAEAAPWDAAQFPLSYDLRDHAKVSPVRSQDGYSTCWIQAAMGSLESGLRPTYVYDFSENNLANHMASKLYFEGQGDSRLSAAYFARWEGPVLESDDPYPRPGMSPEGLVAVRHVQEVLFLPARSGARDNDAIKWAITTHGAVDAAMAWETGSFNYSTNAYYTTSTVLDHHVTCVGWNDSYPAERFKTKPPGDGAFLIRNSWGTDWGAAGYFWISYYDAAFGKQLAVFVGAQARGNYDAIYQYDALGWTRSMGFSREDAWFANRFTAAGSGRVAAVSFYTPGPGATYDVRIAATLGGVATAPVAAAGTIAVGGYHTVRLTTPSSVATGQQFVAAVHLTTPGWQRPVPVEYPSTLIGPRAARRQSYISRDGAAWTDLTTRSGYERANVCLKAFVTAPSGVRDTHAPRAVVLDEQARPGGTAQVPFVLRDPAFSSGSAVVRIFLKTAGGRVLKAARFPAVAVGERGVWRFGCGGLRAGTYRLYARAWDVAGHRQRSYSTATLTLK
jgi:C1A family cysteine protease